MHSIDTVWYSSRKQGYTIEATHIQCTYGHVWSHTFTVQSALHDTKIFGWKWFHFTPYTAMWCAWWKREFRIAITVKDSYDLVRLCIPKNQMIFCLSYITTIEETIVHGVWRQDYTFLYNHRYIDSGTTAGSKKGFRRPHIPCR